jgi:hypothetical protein
MPVKASAALMEPGLVGFFRPVLVVPETLPERLTRTEIDAILAHEIGHLRRRDNLTAALHMVVEALFWFHPLVWWIGGRLIAERERACDEAVIEAGHDRAAYARSLVESCRLYLQSPLSCVAGASGSNLKDRVEAIMTAPPSLPLSPLRKSLLLAAGACAFATPVTAGLLTTPEGQKAVARARAITAVALGVPAPAAAPDQAPPEKPVVLARNEAVLAPALSIARSDVAPAVLSQAVAAPSPEQVTASATPRTEDVVRRWILALQTHQLALLDMTPAVEQSARQQSGLTEQMFRGFGALKALRFTQVTPGGDDAYEAEFAHGRIQVIVGPLTADGKLARLAWGPLWSQDGSNADPRKPLPPIAGMPAPLYRWGTPSVGPAPLTPGPEAAQPAPVALNAADAKQQAAAFVQSYGAFTHARTAARWSELCLRVVGLTPEQEAAVKKRVADVAKAIDVTVTPDCRYSNIQIGFTDDPQGMLDGVLNGRAAALGDRTSDTRDVKTDTLPIQAWYVTNEAYAANGSSGDDGLKVRVRYQAMATPCHCDLGNSGNTAGVNGGFQGGAYIPPGSSWGNNPWSQNFSGGGWTAPAGAGGGGGRAPALRDRQFLNAFVIVDLKRVGNRSLGLISDYVAMVALAEPRDLEHCNALPSVTDLFLECGRPAPDGLTSADAAYLTALYQRGKKAEPAKDSVIAERMANVLAGDARLASR